MRKKERKRAIERKEKRRGLVTESDRYRDRDRMTTSDRLAETEIETETETKTE